ncbi:MAG: DUF4388 domain-containing protein [Candidatus Sericytochromatia bacterium]|nr:DUF4388 domain-containing protein [Candidatus Sericytochromatia bacterium]
MSEIQNKMSSSNINLDGIELMDLFQIAHYLRLTSIIKVTSSENEVGYILFESGEVTHCKIENKNFSEEAFEEILSWDNYVVRNFKYDNGSKLERNINLRFEVFLLNTLRKIDEKRASIPKKEDKKSKDSTYIYEIEKINDFCKNQMLNNNKIISISVLDIKEKNIIGIAYNTDDNKKLVHELTNNFFSIGMNKSIQNIESLLGIKSEEEFLVEEYYISIPIFQISKSISEKWALSLIWGSDSNKIFALKSVRDILIELNKIL